MSQSVLKFNGANTEIEDVSGEVADLGSLESIDVSKEPIEYDGGIIEKKIIEPIEATFTISYLDDEEPDWLTELSAKVTTPEKGRVKVTPPSGLSVYERRLLEIYTEKFLRAAGYKGEIEIAQEGEGE